MYKNPYKTKGAETAKFLAEQYLGSSANAYLIIEANDDIYGSINKTLFKLDTFSLRSGLYITIPQSPSPVKKQKAGTSRKRRRKKTYKERTIKRVVPERVDVSPDSVVAGYSDEVALYIDGKVFKYFDDINISMSFDSIADTFSLSVPFDSTNTAFKKLMRPFSYKEIAIYIGGEKQLQGNIITIKTITTPEGRKLNIDGYSKTGILNDCCPSSETKCTDINGLDLSQIAQLLCDPYGIDIIFEAEVGAKFSRSDKIQIDPSKKIVETLTVLAKMRGLVISNTTDGDLLFHKAESIVDDYVTIDSGKPPCIKSDATYNGQNRYSNITIVKKGKSSGKITIADDELKKQGVFRSIIQQADNSEKGNLKNNALAKIGRTIAESVSISADFFGWRRTDGEIWIPGQQIFFKSPDDFIYDYTMLLVKNVTLNKKSESLTSSLTLCLPECYSGKLRTEYPWDL